MGLLTSSSNSIMHQ